MLHYTVRGSFSSGANCFQPKYGSLGIQLSGLSEKLPLLLESIINEIEKFEISESEFNDGKKEQLEGTDSVISVVC